MSKKSIMNAIKAKCLDCSADDRNEVKLCNIEDCPLWPYRLGKDPDGRKMTDEQKAAAAERFKKMRESKGGAK